MVLSEGYRSLWLVITSLVIVCCLPGYKKCAVEVQVAVGVVILGPASQRFPCLDERGTENQVIWQDGLSCGGISGAPKGTHCQVCDWSLEVRVGTVTRCRSVHSV